MFREPAAARSLWHPVRKLFGFVEHCCGGVGKIPVEKVGPDFDGIGGMTGTTRGGLSVRMVADEIQSEVLALQAKAAVQKAPVPGTLH